MLEVKKSKKLMEHERSRLCGGTNRIIHVLAVLGRDALKAPPQLAPNWCYGGGQGEFAFRCIWQLARSCNISPTLCLPSLRVRGETSVGVFAPARRGPLCPTREAAGNGGPQRAYPLTLGYECPWCRQRRCRGLRFVAHSRGGGEIADLLVFRR